MIHYLRKLYNPEIFQGNLKKTRYFEGWYFKLVSANGEKCAFIPGVSLTKNDSHCFIQFINGDNGQTHYNRYPLEDFTYNKRKLELQIENNSFSENGLSLQIKNDAFEADGKVQFANLNKLQSKLLSPGIMGWYSFVPFMECYHGLVSMDHKLNGKIQFAGKEIDFSNGKGYIEKDWGTSFPKSWIWIQSNNFSNSITSFMFSIAKIPWLNGEFDGFLCVILIKDKWLRFASYTGAKVKSLHSKDNHINISLEDKKYIVKIEVKREHSGVLAAPVFGEMNRSIHESINSEVNVEVFDKKTKETFSDKGIHAGCEIVGRNTFDTNNQ